jgi:Zn-dependent protease with chaperone function
MERVFPASFLDGRTSHAHDVNVSLESDRLVFDGPNSEISESWLYADIRNEDEYIAGRGLNLSHPAKPDARLVITDEEAIDQILSALPSHRRSAAFIHANVPVLLALAILTIGAVGGVAAGFQHVSGFLAAFIPRSWERPIGEALVPELAEARQYNNDFPCRTRIQRRYIGRILETLAAHSKMPDRLEILISPSEEINAFALPGDVILVNQGLIDFIQSDQELAGVLAHEVGHLARHHVMETLMHHLGLQVVIMAMTGGSDAASQIGSAGAQIYALGYNRSHEREADESAVQYMTASGLSTNGLADFLTRADKKDEFMAQLEKHELAQYLSSHPLLGDRIDILKKGFAAPGRPATHLLTHAELKELKAAKALTCK